MLYQLVMRVGVVSMVVQLVSFFIILFWLKVIRDKLMLIVVLSILCIVLIDLLMWNMWLQMLWKQVCRFFGMRLGCSCISWLIMFCSGVMVRCKVIRLCCMLYRCLMVLWLKVLVKMFCLSFCSFLWKLCMIGIRLLMMKLSILQSLQLGLSVSRLGECLQVCCVGVYESEVLWCMVIRQCGFRKMWVLLKVSLFVISWVVCIMMNSELLQVLILVC